MKPDEQKLLPGTGSCKTMVAEKESTQAQYEVPCELSDAHNEDFDLELPYMSVAIPNDTLPKQCNIGMHIDCVVKCLIDASCVVIAMCCIGYYNYDII